MGVLQKRLVMDEKTFGGNILDFYKNNTLYMYEKYQKSDDICKSISISDIIVGRFYFFQYQDPSNWMKYSPIFVIDYRKLNDLVIIFGINFNFIPLEIRVSIFDKFISEQDFKNNYPLKVDFKGVYTELLKYGFEYSIVEYNAIQIKYVHQIHLDLLPRFLYSSHPKNKYDPKKLMEIWMSKLKNREKRHQEIILSMLNEFYDVSSEISDKYDVLLDHVKRLQDSYNKFKNNI